MSRRRNTGRDPGELRRRAERALTEHAQSPSSPPEHHRLLHELHVHQVELEMQNESLVATRSELEAGLHRFTDLFDFAPIGYATLRLDGRIDAINHAGVHLLGQDRADLIGKPFARYVVERDRLGFSATIAAARKSGKRESCVIDLLRADRERAMVRLSAAGRMEPEPSMLIAFEDVTEQQLYQERLAKAEAELREVDRRKDQFLAMLGHELRNPLAPIRNSLGVLHKVELGSEQSVRALAIMDRQMIQLGRLIDELLDISRIKRGKIDLHLEDVELGGLVHQVIHDHHQTFSEAGLTLDETLPPAAMWVHGDAARLTQLLTNLFSNSLKFTPRGGFVRVEAHRSGHRVTLQVRDSGIGIETHVLGELFIPFNQAPQAKDRKLGGLGLGLATVKGLAALHGGTVQINSDGPGRGTVVTVVLPLVAGKSTDPVPRPSVPSTPPPPAEPTPQSQAKPPPTPQPQAKLPSTLDVPLTPPEPGRRRVLVIDDNADQADTLRDLLEMVGHDVHVAYDGRSGIELARTLRPHVVICDVGLPEIDGYEVARLMRHEDALCKAHLIALTGYTGPEERQRALDAGFNEHVAKPPDLDVIERLVAEPRVFA